MNKFHVIFDTNLLVSALKSETGSSYSALNMFLSGSLDLFYTREILFEYQSVIYRPHLEIDSFNADKVIEDIEQIGIFLTQNQSDLWLPDEDDRIFYDTASYANAYLLTWNLKHYPKEYFILTPSEFLKLHD